MLLFAIAFGLMTLVSTVLVFASCWVSASARKTTTTQPLPPLAKRRHQDGRFTMADAAA